MAANPFRKMWTALLGAVFALLAALGFATPATASAPQAEHTATAHTAADRTERTGAPAAAHRLPARSALPPTMKQRIRAEAHGASPSARQRSLTNHDTQDASPVTPP